MDKSLEKLAVVYADVSGSTRLYEQFGDSIARADMAACISLLDKVGRGLAGKTLKTIGDEIMVAFTDPIKAALATTEMQAGLRRAGEDKHFQMGVLHIKIGWHYGKVGWRDEELVGETPVTAQQIIKMAKADEILTSRQAVDMLPRAMFPDVHLIERVPADAYEGVLEIHKMPWERTGDETMISSKPHVTMLNAGASLELAYEGKTVQIDNISASCTIGRGKNMKLRVEGKLTSRQHAEITCRHGRFSIRDVSTNGTYIVLDDGSRKHLRRDEDVLTGVGVLGFGSWPEDDPGGSVQFSCSE